MDERAIDRTQSWISDTQAMGYVFSPAFRRHRSVGVLSGLSSSPSG